MAETSLKNTIERDQAVRLQILHKTYEAIRKEGPFAGIPVFSENKLAEALGLDEDSVRHAVSVLVDEGLAEYFGAEAGFTLTPAGRNEVRQSVLFPSRGTEHFAPSITQHVDQVFNGPIGAVQTGNHNIANVQQRISEDVHRELRQQLAHLMAQVEHLAMSGAREEAIEIVVDLIDAEENQNKAIIKSLPRKESRLLALCNRENLTTAAQLVPPVIEALKSFLGG